MVFAVGAARDAQADLKDLTNYQMNAANAERKATFADVIGGMRDNFVANVGDEIAKVSAWFDSKLEWTAQLRDGQYKDHLVQELNEKKDAAVAALNARINEANTCYDDEFDRLCEELEDVADSLAYANDNAVEGIFIFTENLLEDTFASTAATLASYEEAAAAIEAAKNAYMDSLVQSWANFLRETYGFQGYASSLYQSYDDTETHSGGAGPYSDFGAQGTGAGSSGFENSNDAGFGVGGPGAVDYIDSFDHLSLAFGPNSGPSKDFFGGSILDYPPSAYDEDAFHYEMDLYNGLEY